MRQKGVIHIIHFLRKWFIKTDPHPVKPETSPGSAGFGRRSNGKPGRRFWNYYFYLILGVAAFLFIILSGRLGHPLPWEVKEVPNVHYLDSVGSNFLFRGALPQTGTPPVFNYEGLKKAIQNAGKQAGVKPPYSYYLIDVNF